MNRNFPRFLNENLAKLRSVSRRKFFKIPSIRHFTVKRLKINFRLNTDCEANISLYCSIWINMNRNFPRFLDENLAKLRSSSRCNFFKILPIVAP